MKRLLKILQKISLWFSVRWKNYKARPAALHRAIRKANRLSKRTKGRRYKVYFLENKYQVLARRDIQEAKHRKLFNINMNVTKMTMMAFYDTHEGYSDFAVELLKTKYHVSDKRRIKYPPVRGTG